MEEQIISVSDFAKQLGVSRSLIHAEIDAGRIVVVKLGPKFFGITREVADAYLADRKERGL